MVAAQAPLDPARPALPLPGGPTRLLRMISFGPDGLGPSLASWGRRFVV